MGLKAPADLTAAEKKIWKAVAGEVDDSPVAAELLRAWCASVVELRAAEAWVREHGTVLTLRDDKGNVRSMAQAPKYVQVRALRADLLKLAEALKLSPKARAVADGGSGPVEKSGGSALDELARRRAGRGAVAAGGGST